MVVSIDYFKRRACGAAYDHRRRRSIPTKACSTAHGGSRPANEGELPGRARNHQPCGSRPVRFANNVAGEVGPSRFSLTARRVLRALLAAMKYQASLPGHNDNVSHEHPLKDFMLDSFRPGSRYRAGVLGLLGLAVDWAVDNLSPGGGSEAQQRGHGEAARFIGCR